MSWAHVHVTQRTYRSPQRENVRGSIASHRLSKLRHACACSSRAACCLWAVQSALLLMSSAFSIARHGAVQLAAPSCEHLIRIHQKQFFSGPVYYQGRQRRPQGNMQHIWRILMALADPCCREASAMHVRLLQTQPLRTW
eukprot:scaffold290969_cov18-Tisochrysis_lutea.AAC.1